ncbi:proteasome subunit alpha type-7, putative [Plasmodium knowlesi strain H]|uniref:Proteasome subunit alpha type n=1 Tax=Plasmodium knowlesi (strain H) TaxID=5851 RepID=A0A193REI1_PLAKH|nr:proteasome subunit alpha type-7, putative [Plasmodium knowlesi strain H]
MSYDRAITVFSPDGHLLQVEHALEAVKKGGCAVAIKSSNFAVLAVEKKNIPKLQNPRTTEKLIKLDEHNCLAFAGLNADARVLVNKVNWAQRAKFFFFFFFFFFFQLAKMFAFLHTFFTPFLQHLYNIFTFFFFFFFFPLQTRLECQRYFLNMDEPAPVDYIAKYVAKVQQKFTHRGGVRPFGIATLIAGFKNNKEICIYQTEPSGIYASWKAQAIGKNAKVVQEFLEKNYQENMEQNDCLLLAMKAIFEVVELSSKNIEVALLTEKELRFIDEQQINALVEVIDNERTKKNSQNE